MSDLPQLHPSPATTSARTDSSTTKFHVFRTRSCFFFPQTRPSPRGQHLSYLGQTSDTHSDTSCPSAQPSPAESHRFPTATGCTVLPLGLHRDSPASSSIPLVLLNPKLTTRQHQAFQWPRCPASPDAVPGLPKPGPRLPSQTLPSRPAPPPSCPPGAARHCRAQSSVLASGVRPLSLTYAAALPVLHPHTATLLLSGHHPPAAPVPPAEGLLPFMDVAFQFELLTMPDTVLHAPRSFGDAPWLNFRSAPLQGDVTRVKVLLCSHQERGVTGI